MTFDEWGEHFMAHPPQAGTTVPNAQLMDETGREAELSSLWSEQPAVLVTASLTCPIARSRIPELSSLIANLGDHVARGVLYTKEAHPKRDRSPHADGEWVTPANEREGILHRQPTNVGERLALARTMRAGWTPGYRYFVDRMDDELYERWGTVPCMGLLIDTDGVVRAKQGWLVPTELDAALRELLGTP